jgi:DNA-binding winged helix-turn-helix (wHTH) protein
VRFLFSNYVLDTDLRELTRGGEAVPVEPQVFDLLAYLIESRERVVSKDDLIERIWGGRAVSESTLTSRINAARKAVGDSGKARAMIRTVARKGFRFVGDVQAALVLCDRPRLVRCLEGRPPLRRGANELENLGQNHVARMRTHVDRRPGPEPEPIQRQRPYLASHSNASGYGSRRSPGRSMWINASRHSRVVEPCPRPSLQPRHRYQLINVTAVT